MDSQLNDFCITKSDVLDALVALNPNKTPGPDNLHPQLLKNCAVSLARPLFFVVYGFLKQQQNAQRLENG